MIFWNIIASSKEKERKEKLKNKKIKKGKVVMAVVKQKKKHAALRSF